MKKLTVKHNYTNLLFQIRKLCIYICNNAQYKRGAEFAHIYLQIFFNKEKVIHVHVLQKKK